ncbi:MAG TPA: hypothetical protein VIH18_26095 [Candidatus Binatia bacterium]|jgi:hypothetical protein
MKLRVGNGCWHAGHVLYASVCLAAGFYVRQGLDVEIVDAKVNPNGIRCNRRGGERYDEIDPRAKAGAVFQDQTIGSATRGPKNAKLFTCSFDFD